jgi:hypothetical protein
MRSWGEARIELKSGGIWVATLALSCSGFGVTTWLAPYSQLSPLAAYSVAFCCVVSSVLFTAWATPRQRMVTISGALIALALLAVAQQRSAAGSALVPALCVLVGLLLLGTSVGSWVGSRIQAPGHLLFVAIVSAVADTMSVTQPGGVSAAIANEPAALALLALPWPMLGTRDIVPLLGVGDVVFTSLYVSATRAHALRMSRTLLALGAGYALTTLAVIVWARPIPVLPLLGACVVVAQPAARAISPADRKRGLWAITALACVLAVWFIRRSL